jgi:Flp pilus assembly protein TadD
MARNYKFWITLAVVEVLFGLTVFALTRQYYLADAEIGSTESAATIAALPERPNNITVADLARFDLIVPSQAVSDDPVEISRQANDRFAAGQYDQAAGLYEKLLAFSPDNADTYNNLGITLHYLGRSGEALERLNEGVAADPTHQRIWLTLGFVSSQMGDTEKARAALTQALQLGADEDIRKSANEMLENLP